MCGSSERKKGRVSVKLSSVATQSFRGLKELHGRTFKTESLQGASGKMRNAV